MSSESPESNSNQRTEPTANDVVEASAVGDLVTTPNRHDDQPRHPAIPPGDVPATELTYLHASSLLFDLIAHGKTYLVPAAFGLWGAANGDITLLIISALIFIPAFLTSVFRYFTFRYCIENGQLIVRQGLIFRNVRTVPVSRIQNIDFVQNPLHRLMKVAEVKVETASGTKPEATLRVLSIAKMEKLREAVFGQPRPQSQSNTEVGQFSLADHRSEIFDPTIQTVQQPGERNVELKNPTPAVATLLEIPVSWLVKAGLASNRGMIIIGVLFGAYFQFADRSTFFRFDSYQHLMPEQASTLFIVLGGLAGLVVALLLLRLLGIGWFIHRFFGYQLICRGDDLRISCGLITKVSATIPRQRVQFISIHRNLVMRKMGLASIRIETAGGAGKQGEDATESVSKRWFIPVLPESRIAELMSMIRPGLQWDESGLEFKPLAEKTVNRLYRLSFIQAVFVSAAGMLAMQPWGWLLGIVVLPLLLMWAGKKGKAMRYARTDTGVVYRSGVFIRKTSVTFFEKIQTLRVDQSPFDRRWKMARLSVDTAAAGPADHRIHVPYLDEKFARQELQLLRIKTGQEQPVFG